MRPTPDNSAALRDRVVIVGTGGTIASRPGAAGEGYRPAIGAAGLAGALQGEQLPARIETIDFSSRPSYEFSVANVVELGSLLERLLAKSEVRGAIVTCGTAAMEEIAYLLDLIIQPTRPVVITGAMTLGPDGDGPQNLLAAVRVAAEDEARDAGVLVVMGGEVHSACSVQKLHRTSASPLVSSPGGPVATVAGGQVRWRSRAHTRRHFVGVRPVEPVDVVSAFLGADDRAVRAAIQSGSRGMVVSGFPGGGSVTPAMMAALRDAMRQSLPVVVTSRAPLGRVIPDAGGGSGPADLIREGAIPAGDLTVAKARMLLMCVLASTDDPDEIRRVFVDAAG